MQAYDPNQAMQQQQAQYGQLAIRPSFFFLQWMLFLVSPRISVNGQVQQGKWGLNVYNMPPGDYEVSVWFPWFFFSQCCKGTRRVQVAAGWATNVTYSVPIFLFMSGTMGTPPPSGLLPQGR